MQRIALGFGMVAAMFRKPRTNSFSSIAFIGFPCPRNKAGICCEGAKASVIVDSPPIFIVFIEENASGSN
jgi:hypothetical protein